MPAKPTHVRRRIIKYFRDYKGTHTITVHDRRLKLKATESKSDLGAVNENGSRKKPATAVKGGRQLAYLWRRTAFDKAARRQEHIKLPAALSCSKLKNTDTDSKGDGDAEGNSKPKDTNVNGCELQGV